MAIAVDDTVTRQIEEVVHHGMDGGIEGLIVPMAVTFELSGFYKNGVRQIRVVLVY